MRVLVIEDDRKVANFISTGLEQEGYAIDVLHEGTAAGAQALAYDYDAVVLDLMLPGRSGFQVLRDIRARKATLPILILTAKDSLEERVAGLDSGADDYMVQAVRAGRAVGAAARGAPPRRARARTRCGSPTSRWTRSGAWSGAPGARSTSSRRSTRCSSS